MDYGVGRFLQAQTDRIPARHGMEIPLSGRASWDAWRAETRGAFLAAIDRNRPDARPPFDLRVLWQRERPGYTLEKIVYAAEEGLVNPAYRLIPKSGNGKAVLCIAGHGYGARDLVGLEPDDAERHAPPNYHKDFALSVVARGFAVLVPEMLGFGDLRLEEDAGKPMSVSSCGRITSNLFMAGRTIMGVRVSQAQRAVDLILDTGLSSGRVGMMGISGGGLVTAFAAALDERICAAVVSGYACTFRDSVLAMHHCPDNFAYDLLSVGEMPDLLALISPRPMLWEAGDIDPIFPKHGVLAAYEAVGKAYEAQGVRERLDLDLFHGDHQISGAKAYDFLERCV